MSATNNDFNDANNNNEQDDETYQQQQQQQPTPEPTQTQQSSPPNFMPELMTTVVNSIASDQNIARQMAGMTGAVESPPQEQQQQQQPPHPHSSPHVPQALLQHLFGGSMSLNQSQTHPQTQTQTQTQYQQPRHLLRRAQQQRRQRDDDSDRVDSDVEDDADDDDNESPMHDIVPTADSDEENEDQPTQPTMGSSSSPQRTVSFVIEGPILPQPVQFVTQDSDGILHGGSSSGSSSAQSSAPSMPNDVRIRVPSQFLDGSVTSSGAPVPQQQHNEQRQQQQRPGRRRANAETTSQSTSSDRQNSPDSVPPLRPEPLFSAERRQRTQPQHQQQQQQQQQFNALADPFQILHSLMTNGAEPWPMAMEDEVEVEVCDHNLRESYDSEFEVPLTVCPVCEDAIIAPSDRNERAAKELRFPLSMQRDNRYQELFDMHAEHLSITEHAEIMLRKQRALYLRLYEWERRYGDHEPINYGAQNNPCYREMSRSLDRYVNALQAFSNMSQELTHAHRRRFVKAVYRTFPRNKLFFKTAMRYEIFKAQPNPMLLPGLDALPECTVCGNSANVRLHAHAPRYEMQSIDPFDGGEPEKVEVRQCTCKHFLMCVDCLLDWYWESSEHLKKSFAACPTCKAEFRLEDILRVRIAESGVGGGGGGHCSN